MFYDGNSSKSSKSSRHDVVDHRNFGNNKIIGPAGAIDGSNKGMREKDLKEKIDLDKEKEREKEREKEKREKPVILKKELSRRLGSAGANTSGKEKSSLTNNSYRKPALPSFHPKSDSLSQQQNIIQQLDQHQIEQGSQVSEQQLQNQKACSQSEQSKQSIIQQQLEQQQFELLQEQHIRKNSSRAMPIRLSAVVPPLIRLSEISMKVGKYEHVLGAKEEEKAVLIGVDDRDSISRDMHSLRSLPSASADTVRLGQKDRPEDITRTRHQQRESNPMVSGHSPSKSRLPTSNANFDDDKASLSALFRSPMTSPLGGSKRCQAWGMEVDEDYGLISGILGENGVGGIKDFSQGGREGCNDDQHFLSSVSRIASGQSTRRSSGDSDIKYVPTALSRGSSLIISSTTNRRGSRDSNGRKSNSSSHEKSNDDEDEFDDDDNKKRTINKCDYKGNGKNYTHRNDSKNDNNDSEDDIEVEIEEDLKENIPVRRTSEPVFSAHSTMKISSQLKSAQTIEQYSPILAPDRGHAPQPPIERNEGKIKNLKTILLIKLFQII